MLHTTFSLAKQANACKPSVDKLRAALGPDWGDDKPIPLTLVLEHNGVADAAWALCCTAEPSDKLARLFACDCAERVLPLFERQFPADDRPRQAIEVARRFALGEASAEDLRAAAGSAAGSAAWTAWAAADAARAAAWSARAATTTAATRAAAAAWAATRAAVDAANAASADAARDADEREWQAQRLREMLEAHN